MEFPSPVGGVPFPSDYAPSILFAVMYGLLLPLLAYRILDRKSRNTLLIGTALFSIERSVLLSYQSLQYSCAPFQDRDIFATSYTIA